MTRDTRQPYTVVSLDEDGNVAVHWLHARSAARAIQACLLSNQHHPPKVEQLL